MIIADCQKHFTLKYKRGLIDTGIMKYCRNPNYLGEMMLYAGFVNLVDMWQAWAYLISVWCTVFALRIAMKEVSLMKKKGWRDYYLRSGLILPAFCESPILNFQLWVIAFGMVYFLVVGGGVKGTIEVFSGLWKALGDFYFIKSLKEDSYFQKMFPGF